MGKMITIGARSCIPEIRKRLNKEARYLAGEGINIKIDEDHKGPFATFGCEVPNSNIYLPRDSEDIFRHFMANALADVIVSDLEQYFIRKIIEYDYDQFDPREREEIFEKSLEELDFVPGSREKDIMSKIKRRNHIFYKLLEYLENNNYINMEGFIRFRLKDYFRELEWAVERAVEEFLIEKEYKEFLKILRYFVDIQEPRIDTVQVIEREEGIFQLVDEKGVKIDNEYLDDFALSLVNNDIDYEDLLISALMTAAPARIIIHIDKEREVVETITSIFGERVELCPGCKLCNYTRESNSKAKGKNQE